MTKNEREEIVHLDDLFCLNKEQVTKVTADMQLWSYHGYRVLLRFTQGQYESIKEIETDSG